MKTKLKVYKLHFITPLHIGDARDDYSVSLKTYQSDAMYAAITACLAKVGYAIPANGDLGITISSLFPFYQEHEQDGEKMKPAVYFFPKLLKQSLPELKNISKVKLIKKVSWLELAFFEKMINADLEISDELLDNVQGVYLSKYKIEKDFISSQIAQRVTVSRNFCEDAKPFYEDRIYFKEKSGLFFIAQGDTTLLDKALMILKDEGIGTDRNIGNGFFDISTDEIEIELPQSDYISNLSMFCPESDEQAQEMLNDDNIAYDFMKRGGWITTSPHNTIRKNTIHMFSPASVFKSSRLTSDITVKGKIVDLNPRSTYSVIDHPIWRCGKSFFIPVKIKSSTYE